MLNCLFIFNDATNGEENLSQSSNITTYKYNLSSHYVICLKKCIDLETQKLNAGAFLLVIAILTHLINLAR